MNQIGIGCKCVENIQTERTQKLVHHFADIEKDV